MTLFLLAVCRYFLVWMVPVVDSILCPPCQYCNRQECKGDH